MVDTIKLLLPIANPMLLRKGAFAPMSVEQLTNSYGTARTYLNPSKTYEKLGKYMPRLTLFRRPAKTIGIIYQLAVEFSAPKMLFGNNFDELEEVDFERLITDLQHKLIELIGYVFTRKELAQADISAWHASKNIVFLNYTACQTILNTLGKLDVSRIYDLQKTNFRDGHVMHIHCNSLDVAFYDKMADLRKAIKSDKRAVEDRNYVQLNLLEVLEAYRPMEVLRYEVRLTKRQKIKQTYPALESWTFSSLFKVSLSRNLLIEHWDKLTKNVDYLALDIKQPLELFQNYLEHNQNAKPQAALAAVTGLLICNQESVSVFRNTLEARYGKEAWYRIKPLLSMPDTQRYSYFVHIEETLKTFTPTRMDLFRNNI